MMTTTGDSVDKKSEYLDGWETHCGNELVIKAFERELDEA
jgi:hypothetical protein